MSHWISQSVSNKAVYRTAPATPGMLKSPSVIYLLNSSHYNNWVVWIQDTFNYTSQITSKTCIMHPLPPYYWPTCFVRLETIRSSSRKRFFLCIFYFKDFSRVHRILQGLSETFSFYSPSFSSLFVSCSGSRKVPISPSSARSRLAISEPLQSKIYVFWGAAPKARSTL